MEWVSEEMTLIDIEHALSTNIDRRKRKWRKIKLLRCVFRSNSNLERREERNPSLSSFFILDEQILIDRREEKEKETKICWTMSSNIEDEKDDSGIEQDNHWIYIRIAIEDLHLQKVLKFNLDDRVWIAKQKVLQVLFQVNFFSNENKTNRIDLNEKELNESFNYGLYLPPSNGRAGKFLDESRSLREYPLTGPVSHLEVKTKPNSMKITKSFVIFSSNINEEFRNRSIQFQKISKSK